MNKNSDISGIARPHPVENDLREASRAKEGYGHPLNGSPDLIQKQGTHLPLNEKTQGLQKDVQEMRVYSDPSIFNPNHSEKQIIANDVSESAQASAVISRNSSADLKGQNQVGRKILATPGAESKLDLKSTSTLENSDQFSGARDKLLSSNKYTVEKKVQFINTDVDSQSQHEDTLQQPLFDQKMKDNTEFSLARDNNYEGFCLNSSDQKDSRNLNERARRSCRERTSKYSLTHKGMYTNNQTLDEGGQSTSYKSNTYRSHQNGQPPLNAEVNGLKSHVEGEDDLQNVKEGQIQVKPHKKSVPRTPDQCLRIIQDMLAFDWTQKDISNLRHSPQQELTASIYWFYVNSLYFPFRAFQLSQMPFEEFAKPILQNLKPNNYYNNQIQEEEFKESSSQSSQNQQQSPQKQESQSQESIHKISIPTILNNSNQLLAQTEKLEQDLPSSSIAEERVPEFIQNLFRDKRFKKFKKIFKELQDKATQETFKNPAEQIINQVAISDIKDAKLNDVEELQEDVQMSENKEEQMIHLPDISGEENLEEIIDQKRKIMLEFLRREVASLETYNREQLALQFEKLKNAFQKALSADSKAERESGDLTVYRQDETEKYGLDFLANIEPIFVLDYQQNMEWYTENYNEILLNVCQPSKLEKDFLRHIEFVQQKKSDLKYKKILKSLEQGKRGELMEVEESKYSGLSANKRSLVTQEDAQCAICNNGDYEDEDLIVFCGNCNIPVHQTCYGIEQLPEGDWICYNCEIFGFKKGLLVNCLLCPKKGGSMKPTNIFTSHENFKRYNASSSSQSKKSSKKQSNNHSHSHYLSTFESDHLPHIDSLSYDKRYIIGENEDKNLSLAVILNREFDFQSNFREKQEKLKQVDPQAELELHFDQSEKELQTPEDYSFFLQRNEQRLENFAYPTQTLYEWVHLGCASWIPGPIVTPKTPVRLSKFEEKRFHLQCIICLKKGGACMQCQYSRCTIAFHVECARRSNYCMEIERKDRDKSYRMFCEKHRPLKIVKEMEERDKQTVDEIQKFCKIVDKCMDIDHRHQLKPKKQHSDKDKELGKMSSKNGGKNSHSPSKKNGQKEKSRREPKHHPHEKVKKWREKDKKALFERVKEKYLLFRKMRVNLVRIDPFKKIKKSATTSSLERQRKRSQKRSDKKQLVQHTGGCRAGLRSKNSLHSLESGDGAHEGFNIIINQGRAMSEEDEEEEKLNPEISMDQSQQLLNNMEHSETITQMADQTHGESAIDQDIHYKLAIPAYPTEVDWTVTLSRNDFPWWEIKFGPFTAKDCYEKYSAVIRDPHIFLKKVLGMKEKYKKMMHNQLALGQQIMQQQQQQQTAMVGGGAQQQQDNALYCKCKGTVISDLFVKCDGDEECPNGGWVHPQCVGDLSTKTKEELDELQEYYCDECVSRIKKEEEDEAKGNVDEDLDMHIDAENDVEDHQDHHEDLENNNQEHNDDEMSQSSHCMSSSSSSSSDNDDDEDENMMTM